MTADDISCSEKEQVDELRRRVTGSTLRQDLYDDDRFFLRFLRARNHNLPAAETMIKNHIIWRNKLKIDTILTDYNPPEVFEKYIPLNTLAFDKDGCPVLYSHSGNLDSRGILKCYNKYEVGKYIAYFIEKNLAQMKELSKKLGKPVEKWSFIVNYENFSLSVATHKPSLDVFAHLILLYDLNYPERLTRAYLVNGSFALMFAWNILKPFLSGPTIQKIKIFGKDGWQQEVAKNFDLDCIPAYMGGRLTDPDGNPNCYTIIKYVGKVPENYFRLRQSENADWQAKSKRLLLHRRSKAEVEVEVVVPGSRVDWEFEVRNKDIGFAFIYKGKKYSTQPEYEEVVPKERIGCDFTESGMYLCEKPGIYALEFDNTYSWMYSKEIRYQVTVTCPRNDKIALID